MQTSQKKLAVFPLILAGVVLVAGCAGSQHDPAEPPATSTQAADATPEPAPTFAKRRTIGDALYPIGFAESTRTLLSVSHVVAVVQILSSADASTSRTYASTDATSPTEEPPEGYAQGESPPTLTEYRARVISSFYSAGGQDVPDEITILQSGGVAGGIAWEMEGDPVLEPGKTYFTFMQVGPLHDVYISNPLGRFEVSESGELSSPADEDGFLGVTRELSGKSTAEAGAIVEQEQDGVEVLIDPTPILERDVR